jgi:hypothetical protein
MLELIQAQAAAPVLRSPRNERSPDAELPTAVIRVAAANRLACGNRRTRETSSPR